LKNEIPPTIPNPLQLLQEREKGYKQVNRKRDRKKD